MFGIASTNFMVRGSRELCSRKRWEMVGIIDRTSTPGNICLYLFQTEYVVLWCVLLCRQLRDNAFSTSQLNQLLTKGIFPGYIILKYLTYTVKWHSFALVGRSGVQKFIVKYIQTVNKLFCTYMYCAYDRYVFCKPTLKLKLPTAVVPKYTPTWSHLKYQWSSS